MKWTRQVDPDPEYSHLGSKKSNWWEFMDLIWEARKITSWKMMTQWVDGGCPERNGKLTPQREGVREGRVGHKSKQLLGASRHSSKHVPGVSPFSLTLAGKAEAVQMTCPRSLSKWVTDPGKTTRSAWVMLS